MAKKYLLLDTNVIAAYYLPRSTKHKKLRDRAELLLDAIRTGQFDAFLYVPNFCVAETFSVFMKYGFSDWNKRHVKGGTLDLRVYQSLVTQFQKDIHNGHFFYHYELSRYHILAINLVAPIDHYFQISKGKKNQSPSGTFDQLIIAMGIHLAAIHGHDNVTIVSADDRLISILRKCGSEISQNTIKMLRLDKAKELTGIPFSPRSFPSGLNLKSATKKELEAAFAGWPFEKKSLPEKVYRHLNVPE